jgi:hypothetical protein
VSFNFGSDQGWSYLSGGMGTGHVTTEVRRATTLIAESGTVRNLHVGGGARWFISDHAAISFDLRVHRLGRGDPRGSRDGTSPATLFSTSVGLSVK